MCVVFSFVELWLGVCVEYAARAASISSQARMMYPYAHREGEKERERKSERERDSGSVRTPSRIVRIL